MSKNNARNMHYVLLFFAILAFSTAQQQARIVSSPRSVNVSSGDHAVFNCTAIATFINWEVNGETLNSELLGFEEQEVVDLDISQNLRMRSLTVLGSPDSNNASIACVAVLEVAPLMFVANRSDPALLLVQGLLEPVSDLTVVPINSTTVLISWSPPFTLEGVPILGYNVTITNTTSGENETMSVEGDTTMLYYSIDHPDPDNNFTVTVVPINGARPGENAMILFFTVARGMSTTSLYMLSPTPTMSIFWSTLRTTRSSSTQDIPPPTTTAISVHVAPTLMGPNKPTDLTLGPIIGGIIGVVLVLLVIVLTVIGVIYYRRHKVHKHTRLPHAEHYHTSENPYQVSNIHQSYMYSGMLESCHVQLDGFEEGPLNEPVNASSSDISTTLGTGSTRKRDSGIATDTSHNEDTTLNTSSAAPFDASHDIPKLVILPRPGSTEQTSPPVNNSLPFSISVVDDMQSKSSLFVPNLNPVPTSPLNKPGDNYIPHKEPSRQVSDECDGYSSQSQDASNDRKQSDVAVLPSLQQHSNNIVDGLSRSSKPFREYISHPFGYADPHEQKKQYKKKRYHSENASEMEPLLAISESDDDTQEVSPHNNACAAPQSDDNTPHVSEESPQAAIEDNQTWKNLFENQVEKKSLAAVPAYEEVILAAQKDSPLKLENVNYAHSYQSEESKSMNAQPKETQYAELADFNTRRPQATPQLNPVQYATISPATHERMYGNVGDQKRQANIHGVPSDEDIARISQQVAHKWRLIGLQLGVDPAELDQIAYECGDDQQSRCCSELFRKWAAGEVTASCPFTWKGVIETLDSPTVRESSLARDLESTYL